MTEELLKELNEILGTIRYEIIQREKSRNCMSLSDIVDLIDYIHVKIFPDSPMLEII